MDRIAVLISMVIVVPLGFVIRFSQGPTPAWLNDALGSIAYEIFWILFVVFLFPQVSLLWTAVGVCLVTCGLEFLQLWHSPELLAARTTLAGRLILGNTFGWSDFPAYVVGSALGWVWVGMIRRSTAR